MTPKKLVKANVPVQFSIVSAVYGVEKYIDDFLASVLEQRNFDISKLQIILVDDGSKDRSAAKIKGWKVKYPDQIIYVKQPNQGQSAARNRGIRLAEGEWIGFIDPDDTINDTFFDNIVNAIGDDPASCSVVHTNVILREDGTNKKQRHPLAYRFDDGVKFVSISDKNYMPSSATVSFFKREAIAAGKIKYNKNIRPNFEDGDFSIRYLKYVQTGNAVYAPDSKYYYRKRALSTLSSVWEKPEKFSQVFERGYLPLLDDCQNGSKHVSRIAQKQVMYDLSWYIRAYWRKPKPSLFATPEIENRFWNLFSACISKIDDSIIHDVKGHILSGEQKAWLIGVKHGTSHSHAVIDRFDRYTGQLRIRSVAFNNPRFEIKADGRPIFPTFQKTASFEVLGRTFKENVCWIETKNTSLVRIEVNNRPAKVWVSGRGYNDIPVAEAIWQGVPSPATTIPTKVKIALKLARSQVARKLYHDAWLVMDRDGQADDNAEHLYRYIKESRPDINSYFVLKKTSADYGRLKAEGFKMIPHGSVRHLLLKLNAKFLISSHVDQYVVAPFPEKYFARNAKHKVIFLQHGVIRDDISAWLNTKSIDLFVTTSPQETSSITAHETGYHYTDKEVEMVGLARHDRLLRMANTKERVILIMPTWREWLVGGYNKTKGGRQKNDGFYESSYAKTWKSLLHSDRLRAICERHNYKVVFFPHKNMQIYADWFAAPDWIETRTHDTDPILQMLYARSALMITDYSSVFFEFGIMERPVIHYQFDFDDMYGGKHPSRLGYLDFKLNGFGPVVENESALLRQLEATIRNGCEVEPIYLERMRNTLPLRDGKNCARTVDAIEKRYPAHLTLSNSIPINKNTGLVSQKPTTKIKLPKYGLRVTIVGPFVKLLGNDNDLKKLRHDPAQFFSKLRNPVYRVVGKLLFSDRN